MSALLNLLNVGIGFMISVILARSLGAAEYGHYVFVLSVATLLSIPGQRGLPKLIMREVAKRTVCETHDELNGIMRWGFKFCVFVTLFVLATWIPFSTDSLFPRSEILIASLLVLFASLGNVRGALLRGVGLVIQGQLPELFFRPFILWFCLVISVFFLSSGLTTTSALGLNMLAAFGAMVFGQVLLRHYRPDILKRSGRQPGTDGWVISIFTLSAIGGLQILNATFDILALRYMLGSEHVGIYRIMAMIASFGGVGLQVINAVIGPRIVGHHHSGRTKELQEIITFGARIVFGFSIIVTCLVVFFGPWFITHVYGDEFSSGFSALIILVVGQLASAFFGSVGLLLILTGRERLTFYVVGSSALLNISLNVGLIPLMGLNGAALATFVSVFISNLLLWFYVRSKLGIASTAFGF